MARHDSAERRVPCEGCGAPARPAICAASLDFEEVAAGDWIALVRCASCGALWARVPYEPYATYDYLVPWPWDAAFWRSAYDLDGGATLHGWHEAVLVGAWESLWSDDRAAVEQHAARGGWVSTPFFRRVASDAEWDGLVSAQRTRLRLEGKPESEIEARLPRRETPVPDLERLVPPNR
jgi:hypothetical protein